MLLRKALAAAALLAFLTCVASADIDEGDLVIGVDRTVSFATPVSQDGTTDGCPVLYCSGPGTEIRVAHWQGSQLYGFAEIVEGTDFRAQYPCQDTIAQMKGSALVHAVEDPTGEQEMDAVVETVISYDLSCDREIAWADDPTPTVVSADYQSNIYMYPPSQAAGESNPISVASQARRRSHPTDAGGATWPWRDSGVDVMSSLITIQAGYDYKFSWTASARCCESPLVRATWAWSKAKLTVHSIRVRFLSDIQNLPPVAVAALNDNSALRAGDVVLEVDASLPIQLDGSASADPEGEPLSYSWSLVEKPPASTASISNTLAVDPHLYADLSGTYRVRLVVNDGVHASEPSVLTLTIILVEDTPEWRQGLQRGDLVFYTSAGDFASLLGAIGKLYTHVGIYLGNGVVLHAHFSGGVSFRTISDWDDMECAAAYRVMGATSSQIEGAISFAQSRLGSWYDFDYTQRSDDGSTWYCSELVWAAFKSVGILLGQQRRWAISPDDLIHSSGSKLEAVGHYGTSYEEHCQDAAARIIRRCEHLASLLLCPVTVSVTDPSGRSIGPDTEPAGDVMYSEFDLDYDGEADSAVCIASSSREEGEYLITVTPKDSALPTDTYTLHVRVDGQEVTLAEDIAVSDIPAEPYRYQASPPPTTAAFRVDATGRVFSDETFHASAFASEAADVAEWVSVSETAEPGDILELDPLNAGSYRLTTSPCSSLVAGIITTEPGVVLGASTPHNGQALLALVGIVPVKVTGEGGPIMPGDLLVTSSTPGHAMRWSGPSTCPCALVGKALEPMAGVRGVILVLLTAH